jgi:hypothetical protein
MDRTAKDLGSAMIPIYTTAELPRWHDITFDNEGSLWQINGNAGTSFAEAKPGLIKDDPATGQVLETPEFIPVRAIRTDLKITSGHSSAATLGAILDGRIRKALRAAIFFALTSSETRGFTDRQRSLGPKDSCQINFLARSAFFRVVSTFASRS